MGTVRYERHPPMGCRTQAQRKRSGQTRSTKEKVLLRRKEPSHKQGCGRMVESRNHQTRPISNMDIKSSIGKKPDGSWRMCIDFKNLNSSCRKDYYPLPEIDWKIESVTGFRYKCFLDAYKGYHQVQMAKEDEEKTAFYTDHGTYCYTKMPFGLKNAGATYHNLVDTVFRSRIG